MIRLRRSIQDCAWRYHARRRVSFRLDNLDMHGYDVLGRRSASRRADIRWEWIAVTGASHHITGNMDVVLNKDPSLRNRERVHMLRKYISGQGSWKSDTELSALTGFAGDVELPPMAIDNVFDD